MTSGCSTDEKVLITGATGKIAFPIARALAERNEVWGAARLRNPADRDRLSAAGITPSRSTWPHPTSPRCPTISATSSTRRWTPAPTTGRDASRRTRTTRVTLLAPLPHRQGLRLLLDRLDLRLPGPAPAARDPIRQGCRCGRTTASRKIAAEVGVHLGRRPLRHSPDDHPDLLDLRARGRRTGRPPRDDVGGQADSTPSRTSRTTTTRSTRTTTSNSASGRWRSPTLPRSS